MKREIVQGIVGGLLTTGMFFFGLWIGGKINYWKGWEKGYAQGYASHPVVNTTSGTIMCGLPEGWTLCRGDERAIMPSGAGSTKGMDVDPRWPKPQKHTKPALIGELYSTPSSPPGGIARIYKDEETGHYAVLHSDGTKDVCVPAPKPQKGSTDSDYLRGYRDASNYCLANLRRLHKEFNEYRAMVEAKPVTNGTQWPMTEQLVLPKPEKFYSICWGDTLVKDGENYDICVPPLYREDYLKEMLEQEKQLYKEGWYQPVIIGSHP